MTTGTFGTREIVEAMTVALNRKREELVEEHTQVAAKTIKEALKKYALEIVIEMTMQIDSPYHSINIRLPIEEQP